LVIDENAKSRVEALFESDFHVERVARSEKNLASIETIEEVCVGETKNATMTFAGVVMASPLRDAPIREIRLVVVPGSILRQPSAFVQAELCNYRWPPSLR
jgi:hypothetical protein